jgi:GntR family transcriptional regulator/MocR family aminotransferase
VSKRFPFDLVVVDRNHDKPLYQQLYAVLRNMIETHALPSGMEVPSSRELADDMNIARNTVIAAYDQLVTEGFIVSRPNARATVVELPKRNSAVTKPPVSKLDLSKRGEILGQQPIHHGTPGQNAFHPGMPDAPSFPYKEWSKILAKQANENGTKLFGTYHVVGHPQLREAIAAYLGMSRGVRCTADQVVITTGAQAAFDLLSRLLLDPGDQVWMEEPGYFGAQAAFSVAGGELHPLQVDEFGWNFNLPHGVKPRIICVTPACQHPFGITMTIEERIRLLDIAQENDSWIIEDDYDGEYRFDGRPVPSLQGMDRLGRVIYIGTFAKILFPALRLGYIVVPPLLVDKIARALSTTGQFAPLLLQAAVAEFIESGKMARHLSRMRRLYAQRRKFFSEICKEKFANDLTLVNGGAGIQIVGLLSNGKDDVAIAAQAQKKGINLSPLSKYYRHSVPRRGFVLGYAASDDRATKAGLQKLHEIISD